MTGARCSPELSATPLGSPPHAHHPRRCWQGSLQLRENATSARGLHWNQRCRAGRANSAAIPRPKWNADIRARRARTGIGHAAPGPAAMTHGRATQERHRACRVRTAGRGVPNRKRPRANRLSAAPRHARVDNENAVPVARVGTRAAVAGGGNPATRSRRPHQWPPPPAESAIFATASLMVKVADF